MKTNRTTAFALLSQLILFSQSLTCFAQGTAFRYQGRLSDNGAPANGLYELRFTIYDSSAGSNLVTGPLTNSATPVSGGLFIAALDFGSGVFTGADRWLEIAVRTNGGGPFVPLAPRQKVSATPYAITAGDVTSANIARLNVPNSAAQATGHPVITSGFITGAVVDAPGSGYSTAPAVTVNANGPGSGAVITATISGGSVSALNVQNAGSGYTGSATLALDSPPPNNYQVFVTSNFFPNVNVFSNPANVFAGNGVGLSNLSGIWKLGGNAGANPTNGNFIGTSDNQSLELRVNGARALRMEPNTNGAPNMIGGASVNFVVNGVVGATIAGGGATNLFGFFSYTNRVVGDFGTVSGGYNNSAGGLSATVGGGSHNAVSGQYSTVSGGANNTAGFLSSTVSGGGNNTATNNYATVGGGAGNWAGRTYTTIGGGNNNAASGSYATVGGGANNTGSGDYSTVSGNGNTASGMNATVGGGAGNSASGFSATVPGGVGNIAAGADSFAAGKGAQALHDGSFVWNDVTLGSFSSTANNQFAIRATGGLRFAGDVQLSDGYRNLSLTGGNALGYLYGSFPALGDGIHLAYNHFYDANGVGHVANAGGATSRLTVGYGFVGLYISTVANGAPTIQRLLANSAGVTVNGTFNNSSDRNAKQDFKPINPSRILEKVVQLPIVEWSYKEDPATRHVGPMAQDFHAAFNIGTDDKHIAPLDEGGIALAAIQAFNHRLADELKRKDEEYAVLKQRLEKLERLVLQKSQDEHSKIR